MSIEVRNIRKQFGNFVAVDDVNLHVGAGELVALLGPSGSGKTTLLRMIAGLEFPDSGTILLNDEDATNHDPARRRVGFVFQHYALFRHMTIFENVAFGLRVQPRKVASFQRRDSRSRYCTCSNWCNLKGWRATIRTSSPADRDSASRWPAPWRLSPSCCCWMSLLARSMPRCAKSCAAGCGVCMTKFTSPACL